MNNYQLASPGRLPPDEATGCRYDSYWLVRGFHVGLESSLIRLFPFGQTAVFSILTLGLLYRNFTPL